MISGGFLRARPFHARHKFFDSNEQFAHANSVAWQVAVIPATFQLRKERRETPDARGGNVRL
jgi:hypothetical protein